MYVTKITWKFHWDQASMASATAFKAIGGQIQNLHFTHYHCFVLTRDNIEKRHCFSLRGLIQITSWNFENCRYQTEKCLWTRSKFFKAINFTAVNQKKWNQSKWIHNQLVCKFWIWPRFALEAVDEAILPWSQRNS